MRAMAVCVLSALALGTAGCGGGGQPTAESSAAPSTVTPSPDETLGFSNKEAYLIALRTSDESADLVKPYSDELLIEGGHLACEELAAGANRIEISSALVNAGIDDVVLTATIPFAAVAALCPDMEQAMEEAAIE